MIIDAHTHIFPGAVRSDRNPFFDSEGAFKLLYESDKSQLAGADDLVDCLDREGLDMAVTFGFPWQNPDLIRTHNDYIIESQQRYPTRLAGLCCVDIYAPAAPLEVERCLDAGLYGVGELACYLSGIDDEALKHLAPIMEICRNRNKPVLIHTNEPVGHVYPGKTPISALQMYNLAKTFPENRIVLAHWGGGIFFFNLLKREAKDVLKNLWFDTAASPYLYDPAVYAVACQLAGNDRVMFGSDFPLLPPSRYFQEINAAGLDSVAKAALLGYNAAAFFGLNKTTA